MDIPAPTPLAARPTLALGCIGGCFPGGLLDEAIGLGFAPVVLPPADDVLARAAVNFGRALAHADQLQQAIRTFWIGHGQAPDIELSFSGTRKPTSFDEFVFLTLESARRGLNPVSIAPSLGAA